MLDEKDLQALDQLISHRLSDVVEAALMPQLNHLSDSLSAVKQDVAEIRIDLENRVDPQLQALAEGQQVLLQKLAPRDRVEQLEDEIIVLKSAVRALSQDVAELKKAQ